MKNKIFSILGPTASGKTKLSIEIAQKYKAEILSSDSRQFYKELNIGVAKPTQIELNTVKHHFINSHSIQKPLSAGQYSKESLEFCKNYFLKNNFLILVGGSGLFTDALTIGIDDLPSNFSLNEQIALEYEKFGIDYLIHRIKTMDASVLGEVDLKNPRRLIRALEILTLQKEDKMNVNHEKSMNNDFFDVFRCFINWKRADLYDRINLRVDQMMEMGLLEEAKNLYPVRKSRALKTVGYQELFDFIENKCSLTDAVDKIKQHSRNYAKRQLTWLKRYDEVYSLDPYSSVSLVEQFNDKISIWNEN